MEYGFLSRAGKFLQEQAKSRRGTMVFLCLAAGVTLGTLGFLKLYGQAMTHKVKMLDCQYEVHEHTEDCYEENEDGEKVLICGLADYVIHVHNDDCYDQKGELVCQLEEHELHEHDESCWEEEEILICEEEESEGSAADGEEAGTIEDAEQAAEPAEDSQAPEAEEEESGSNAETVKELACEKEEHKHDDSCYADGAGCEKEAHTHGDSCYEKTEELVCDASEHTHDDSCYTTGESELTCEESEHTHDDGCYDEEGNEVCGESEHTHDDGCYSEGESELTCGAEEHTHGDGCYEVTETLVCETEEHEHDDSCAAESELVCGIEEHEHDDSCYVEVEAETEEKEESESAEETGSAEEAKPEETVKEEDTQEKNNEEAEEGHTHTDDCYETREVLTCGELELHTHDADPESETCCYSEDCFDEEGSLIEGSRPSCGLLQLEEHIHTEECFKTVELTPEEIAAINGGATLHVHTDECYDEEGNLICGHEVTHLHQLECYDEDGNLICGFGGGSHVHEESCYDEEGNLICGYETATHPHTADCYDEAGNLVCGYETASHVHEENCYDEEGNLICGYETAAHPHTPDCYDEEGNLVCGYETASHVHEENCYDEEGNLICGYETAVHPHTPDCYDEAGNLICGYETAVHVHDESCYDEEGNLICGYEAEEHEHDIHCYDEEGNLICGYEDAKDHEHDSNCYDEGGNLICGYEGVKNHEHDANCYDIKGNLVCGYEGVEDHVHTEACYDEKGNLICGYEVLEVYDNRKFFESDKYIVVVKYNNDANIPEEAELIAEEITAENDKEHYENRETEYRKMIRNANATMRALLKIGFYLNGEEIEPETPVMVTVQFLDEDGLAEGKSISIVHFGKEGSEKLNGGNAKSSSTTFKMGSFSEIAIGYEPEEDNKIFLSDSFEYDNDEFHITFHIEGEGVLVEDTNEELNSEKKDEHEAADDFKEGELSENDSEHILSDGEADIITEEELSEEENPEFDDEEKESSKVVSDNGLNLEFNVEPLSEEAEKYLSFMSFVEESSEENGVLLLRVLSYSLTCDGIKVDLTNCQVTADFTPTGEMVESTQSFINVDTLDLDDEEMPEEDEADGVVHPELVFTALGQAEETQPCEIYDAVVLDEEETTQTRHIMLTAAGTDNVVGYALSSAANPSFTVQYYAKLNTIAEEATGTYFGLNVVDTENKEAQNNDVTGAGGKLPKNTPKGNLSDSSVYQEFERYGSTRYRLLSPSNAGVKKIYLNEKGEVQTTSSLLRIYEDRGFEYINAPNLIYFNRLAENGNYEIKEIWIGDKPDSTNESDWEIKKIGTGDGEVLLENVHFTNKPATAETEGFILIKAGTVIKLVCEPTWKDVTNGASFYDYNISDGKIYTSNSISSSTIDDRRNGYNDTNTLWYINTGKQGINSNGNKLAFGNNNTKTTLGNEDVSGNYLNRINAVMSPTFYYLGFEGCTFGLADSLKEDGTIQYGNGVNATDMFNEAGSPNGKEVYTGSGNSLTFRRVGDTYTLTTATVSGNSITGLDKFNQPQSSSGNDIYATNNFWPMDKVKSAGTAGNDPMFGSDGKNKKLFGFSADGVEGFPDSDDLQIHNSYFGMHYTVDFELTDDYVGPLEYLFYGDDDMWVFLSPIDELNGKITGSGKLICDIGGVHSSVGEYVNLWDWIKKGDTGAYRLSFFYTERGASGSTCWMQFTLPSVSFSTPEQNTGSLLIEKKVTGAVTEDDEFGFEIKFEKGGKVLQDDYSYAKYKRLGAEPNPDTDTFLERDVLIWNNAKFTVKADEYIVISYLPDGTTYTITEVGPVEVQKDPNGLNGIAHDEEGNPIWTPKPNNPYHPTTSGGSTVTPGVVTGTISKQNRVGIAYTNNLMFALPETGGPGTDVYAAAGALLILLGAGFVYKKKFRERRV